MRDYIKALGIAFLLYVLGLLSLVSVLPGCAAYPPLPEVPDASAPDLPLSSVNQLRAGKRCSSVAIAPNLALTAKHCEAESGDYLEVDGTSLGVAEAYDHPDVDLTLVVTEEPYLTPVRESVQASLAPPPYPGSPVFQVGYGCSGGAFLEVTPAVYLGVDSFTQKLEFGGIICNGDSGGAVLNEEGLLIGVAVSREASGKPLFWAVASMHYWGI